MDSLIKIFIGVLSGEKGSRYCRKDNNEKTHNKILLERTMLLEFPV
jgi:hypothetical protein